MLWCVPRYHTHKTNKNKTKLIVDMVGPRFRKPRSLYNDSILRAYTLLLVLRPTAFNRVGMVSIGLGGRDSDGTRVGRGGCTGDREDRRTLLQPLGTGRVLGRRSSPEGGDRACGWWRQVEVVRYPRAGEPLGLTGTWVKVADGKGGATDEGRKSQARARNSLVRPSWEGIADERWRLAGGGAV